MKITNLTPLLNVESVPRSIAFYCDHLGFRVTQQWEDQGRVRWASLAADGVCLMLNEPHNADSDQRRNRQAYEDTVFYFAIDDVDALHAQLETAGVAVGKISNEHYGMREFYIRDPDGYELGFGTPIESQSD
jgi:catechol 2,3-dioxygenase-like lactoylglutathione lyase family enzyme